MASQSDLCREVLVRMRDKGLLDELILVGSWCLAAYQDYFSVVGKVRLIRTRDMDFLVPTPSRLRTRVDMVDLLDDLGFILGRRGNEGFMRLQHPELMIEFIVADRGRGTSRAVDLPALGMNAQALRFMDIPMMSNIPAELHGVTIRVPHPAAFALHKLLVAPRRRLKEGRKRDSDIAVHLIDLIIAKGETLTLRTLYEAFPRSWRKTINRELINADREDLLAIFA